MSNIEFREMDAEQPDLPESSINAILCRLGLMFLPNLSSTLIRLQRLLVPGGRFAAAVWGPSEKSPFNSVTIETIRKALNVPPPPPGGPGTFSLSDESLLRRIFTEGGFTGVMTEAVEIEFGYDSLDEFIHERYTTSASIRAMLADASDAEQATAWGRVAEEVAKYTEENGTISLPAQILCVVGQRK